MSASRFCVEAGALAGLAALHGHGGGASLHTDPDVERCQASVVVMTVGGLGRTMRLKSRDSNMRDQGCDTGGEGRAVGITMTCDDRHCKCRPSGGRTILSISDVSKASTTPARRSRGEGSPLNRLRTNGAEPQPAPPSFASSLTASARSAFSLPLAARPLPLARQCSVKVTFTSTSVFTAWP